MRQNDEHYYDDEDDAPRSRVLGIASVLAGILALVGFVWLAWHAYVSGSATYDPNDAELVKANSSPYKEVPQDPGGWQAPHRDKTIYEVIERGNAPKSPSVAERLTAAPEEPMEVPAEKEKAAVQTGSSGTWMNSKLREDGTEVPLTEAERQKVLREESKRAEAAAPKPEPVAEVVEKKPEPVKTPVAEKPAAEVKEKVAEKPAAAPKVVAESKAAASSAPSGPAKLQLGAFRNEGDAAAHVKHLNNRAPGALTGKSITVERADLGEKGIYYRLFALGFANKTAANDACAKIKAARLDCMVK